ncbi:MAG: apolipoprotein N-acyltransferase [Planctomycetaceae bacterium]
MTTTMLPEAAPKTVRSPRERTVEQIIDTARAQPAEGRGAWIVSGATAALLWASFTPLDWGPLAWVALVPLILLIRLPRPTRSMYRAVLAGGFLFNLMSLQWMRLGHAAMYPAWVATAAYMALYFVLFVGLSRVAVHRLRVPLWVAVPVVWVGLEYVRGHFLTGFGWYYLAHTQYRWLELIQISDVTGAYGVSFLIALANAALAGLVPESAFRKLRLLPAASDGVAAETPVNSRRPWIAVAVAMLAFASVLSYGHVRRGQAAFREGPRIALVQGNFISQVKHDPNQWVTLIRVHRGLTSLAIPYRPDVVIWPETMFPWPLHAVDADLTDEQLVALAPPEIRNSPRYSDAEWIRNWRNPDARHRLVEIAEYANSAAIIGVGTQTLVEGGPRRYNSAVFIDPALGITGRYDKLHRVPFGEYIPFSDVLPFLRMFSPYGGDSGLTAGARAEVFEYAGARLAPVICFEDTVPHLVRKIVRATRDAETGQPVDVIVNLTNDGWFHGSSELDQHLITAAFRAVETRTPMVRAVNTGISAVIDGDGAIVEPDVFLGGNISVPRLVRGGDRDAAKRAGVSAEERLLEPMSFIDPATGRPRKSLDAVLIDDVPLDDRDSLYVAWGDWFAGTCGMLALGLVVIGLVPKRSPATSRNETDPP